MSMEYVRDALGFGPEAQRRAAEAAKARLHEIEDALRDLRTLLYNRARAQWTAAEEREYAQLRRMLMESGELATETLEFLKRNRTGNHVYANVVSKWPKYNQRALAFDKALDATFDRLEGIGGDLPVEIDEDKLDALDMANVKALWYKAKQRLDSDPDGAVTAARSLLESVCKRIITASGEQYRQDEKVWAMCKRCVNMVLPAATTGQEHFVRFAGAASTMVQHIALYRDDLSDAHGTEEHQEIADHHAEYAVSLAGATAVFLVECFFTTHGGPNE